MQVVRAVGSSVGGGLGALWRTTRRVAGVERRVWRNDRRLHVQHRAVPAERQELFAAAAALALADLGLADWVDTTPGSGRVVVALSDEAGPDATADVVDVLAHVEADLGLSDARWATPHDLGDPHPADLEAAVQHALLLTVEAAGIAGRSLGPLAGAPPLLGDIVGLILRPLGARDEPGVPGTASVLSALTVALSGLLPEQVAAVATRMGLLVEVVARQRRWCDLEPTLHPGPVLRPVAAAPAGAAPAVQAPRPAAPLLAGLGVGLASRGVLVWRRDRLAALPEVGAVLVDASRLGPAVLDHQPWASSVGATVVDSPRSLPALVRRHRESGHAVAVLSAAELPLDARGDLFIGCGSAAAPPPRSGDLVTGDDPDAVASVFEAIALLQSLPAVRLPKLVGGAASVLGVGAVVDTAVGVLLAARLVRTSQPREEPVAAAIAS